VHAVKLSRAIAVDVICILLFAIVGRSNHNESTTFLGVADTAWPFLAGCALGILISRGWRRPEALPTGIGIWACTVLGGMVLRLLSGDTAQTAFVIVATISLALLLLGWRAGYVLIQRTRKRTHQETSV
jgi:peptidoglycan/LPS O-acetylase OafA/YrhL